MEPVGAKGIYEVVTGELAHILSPSTVEHTPWTRVLYPRTTTGPAGELIPDLVEWVRDHWEEVILKPVYGYSGKGIFVGPERESQDEDIQTALEGEPYIVQSFIPKGLWAEEYPWLDRQGEEVDKMGLELGHTYLRGPTPTTLRPRVITQDHLASLQDYSAHLWSDLLILERMWLESKLDHVVQMGEEESEIARMQPWGGSPALIASDCLFSFGAHLRDV